MFPRPVPLEFSFPYGSVPSSAPEHDSGLKRLSFCGGTCIPSMGKDVICARGARDMSPIGSNESREAGGVKRLPQIDRFTVVLSIKMCTRYIANLVVIMGQRYGQGKVQLNLARSVHTRGGYKRDC